jgi:hypothetical protein
MLCNVLVLVISRNQSRTVDCKEPTTITTVANTGRARLWAPTGLKRAVWPTKEAEVVIVWVGVVTYRRPFVVYADPEGAEAARTGDVEVGESRVRDVGVRIW